MKTKSGFYISPGNSKVRFVIVNTGPGLGCPSSKWCPFSIQNHRDAGRNLCYAQKTEKLRPNVLASRLRNKALIASQGPVLGYEAAEKIADHIRRTGKPRIVRINESGDLSARNISFIERLAERLGAHGIKAYAYSKAPHNIRQSAKDAGVVVLHSEHDFVAVKTEEEGIATGLPKCPGVCGPCTRCPEGKKSWILEH